MKVVIVSASGDLRNLESPAVEVPNSQPQLLGGAISEILNLLLN